MSRVVLFVIVVFIVLYMVEFLYYSGEETLDAQPESMESKSVPSGIPATGDDVKAKVTYTEIEEHSTPSNSSHDDDHDTPAAGKGKADNETVANDKGNNDEHDTPAAGEDKADNGTVANGKGNNDHHGSPDKADNGTVADGKGNNDDHVTPGNDDDHSTLPNNQSVSINADERANMELCGKPRCRIFFVFRHAEQETRANIWFRVFVEVARRLDRVMVLPNVGGSRIFSCRSWPFDTYYDVDKLREQYPDVTFVEQADFKAWTMRRTKTTTVRLFNLSMGQSDQQNTVIRYEKMSADRMKRMTCMNSANLKFERTNVYNTHVSFADRYFSSKKSLTRTRALFFNELERTDPDVILLTHSNVNTKLIKFRDPPLVFSKHVIEEAMAVVDILHPYVAIHWRMEDTGHPEKLPDCALALVEFLKKFSRENNLQRIYLATDYPIVGGGVKGQSDTFSNINQYHHTAIRTLNESLTISTWNDLLNSNFVNFGNLKADVQGILDKLVCTHAEYFLRAPAGCRKRSSNWTNNVIYMRNELYKEQLDHGGLKNIFQEWPKSHV